MSNSAVPSLPSSARAPSEQIQSIIHNVVRRQWWMWSSCFLVMLLLTLGIASFAFPGLLSEQKELYTFNLNLAVRSLVGLVLLFNVYAIYQQLQIQRIQSHLRQQIGAFDRLGERTEQVYKIAAIDSVTGLYNRHSGEQRLAEEVLRSQRHSRPLTILTLDLNGLKQINDTYGHPAGDLMLRHFAERLQSAIRGSDVPIRLGGDEFLILLPECKVSEVHYVLNRLSDIVGEFEGHKIPLRFAAGWTDYIPGESSQALIMRADTALYANKRAFKEKREEKAADEAAVPSVPASAGKSPSKDAVSTLKPREFQVLKLLVQGKSNKEVAGTLNISVRTVETHRAHLMNQLNVHSVSELILYAVRNKIIKVDEISQ